MFCLIRKLNINISLIYSLVILFLLDQNHLTYCQVKPSELVIKLTEANNDFALSMFDIISTSHGNQVISPISLLSAFAIIYNGAGSTTRSDLEEFLKFKANELDENEVNESFKYLYNSLIKKLNKNDKIELNMFNAVLSQLSLELKPGFQNIVKTCFKAHVIIENFKNSDSLVDLINQQIKTQTNNKIEKLIESELDPQTQLMIINAVYFKGLWETEFKEKDTKDQVFWNSKNEKEKIKMMILMNKEFNYMRAPGVLDAQILELPYLGKMFSLVILLPRERNGLLRMKLNFNSKHVKTFLKQMVATKVNVFLPKFKFSEKYSIKELLEERIGKQMFDTGADFSRMTDQKNLVLNEILHKVVIEVNEKGTEAAAATGVGLVSRSLEYEEIVQFKVEHPFMYLIIDRRTDMILFLGQVTHLTDYEEDLIASDNQAKQNVKKLDDQDNTEPGMSYDDMYGKMNRRRYGFENLKD